MSDVLAMSDEAFSDLLLLILTGAYALAGLVWMTVVIVDAVRGDTSDES